MRKCCGGLKFMKKQTVSDEKIKAIEQIMDDLYGEGKAGEMSVDAYVVKREWNGEEWLYIITKPFAS